MPEQPRTDAERNRDKRTARRRGGRPNATNVEKAVVTPPETRRETR